MGFKRRMIGSPARAAANPEAVAGAVPGAVSVPGAAIDGGTGPGRDRWVVLVHWHDGEWRELAAPLEAMGWRVQRMEGAPGLRLRDPEPERPVAILISLRRLPSHGREMAGAVWHPRWARTALPLVFFDGSADAVAVTRARFPAAHYTPYGGLHATLERLHRSDRAPRAASAGPAGAAGSGR